MISHVNSAPPFFHSFEHRTLNFNFLFNINEFAQSSHTGSCWILESTGLKCAREWRSTSAKVFLPFLDFNRKFSLSIHFQLNAYVHILVDWLIIIIITIIVTVVSILIETYACIIKHDTYDRGLYIPELVSHQLRTFALV